MGHSCHGALGSGGAMGGPRSVPRGPRKSPRKKEAWERVVKAKVDAVCFLEKGRNKKNESK